MIVMLDTNAYSAWRRSGMWHETLARAEKILVPAIVVGELDFGFRNGTRWRENSRKFEDFLSQAQVAEWTVGAREARIYGGLVQELKQRGTPIPSNDVWIAACNQAADSELLTDDAHFRSLPQLRVRWMDG